MWLRLKAWYRKVTNTPPDWMDLLSYAADEVHDCIRLNHDDTDMELKMRQASIDRAMEYLRDARAALPGASACRR